MAGTRTATPGVRLARIAGQRGRGPIRPPRPARREPGATLPAEMAGDSPPVPQVVDEALLKRISTVLRALR